MAEVTWTPDGRTPSVYADLSGDRNPVHLDEEHARRSGFPSVIVHGMCALGAAARAAHLWAPAGSVLRALDVRFANALLPNQRVTWTGTPKEVPGGVRVALEAKLDDGKVLINPAFFTFSSAELDWPLPKDVLTAADEKDILGDPRALSPTEFGDYLRVTESSSSVAAEPPPAMIATLGMTGALERSFRQVDVPARPGTWVHLRQSGSFLRALDPAVPLITRIQAGRIVARTQSVGVHVTIPFLVEGTDGSLSATGACVLLYAFME